MILKYWLINACKIHLKMSYMNVFACLFPTTGCVVTLLLFLGVTRVLHEIKLNTDIYEVSIWIASQFRMGSMALSVWFNRCCPCQSLTCVGATCKDMLFVWLHVSWTNSYIGFWKLPGFFMIKFVYQICVKCLSVIKLHCWCWSVNIMNHILPLALSQMDKHKSRSIQVYTSSLIDNNIQISPLFPDQGDYNAIQNKWYRGNEINNQQNQK